METVGGVLRTMFPQGTQPGSGSRQWRFAPIHPVDVFAAAAMLLERSGAYHHVVALPAAPSERSRSGECRILISETDRRTVSDAAGWWRTVVLLLMAADSAAAGLGFPARPDPRSGLPQPIWLIDLWRDHYAVQIVAPPDAYSPKARRSDLRWPA